MDPIEVMDIAIEAGAENPESVFLSVLGKYGRGHVVVRRSEIVAFAPGYNAKGNHAWFLYTKSHVIEIDEDQYDLLVDYFEGNTTLLEGDA